MSLIAYLGAVQQYVTPRNLMTMCLMSNLDKGKNTHREYPYRMLSNCMYSVKKM